MIYYLKEFLKYQIKLKNKCMNIVRFGGVMFLGFVFKDKIYECLKEVLKMQM